MEKDLGNGNRRTLDPITACGRCLQSRRRLSAHAFLAIWFLFPRFCDDPGDHVREQSLLFHLIVVVVGGALWGATGGLWAIIIIGWPFAIAFGLVASIFSIWSVVVMLIAVVKTALGEPYRLPLVARKGIAR